jgi:hypothetical protein
MLALLYFLLAAVICPSHIPLYAVEWFGLSRVITLNTTVILDAVGKEESFMKSNYLPTVHFLK